MDDQAQPLRLPASGRSSIDYVLRTSQQSTLHLSAMADQKASVVLGASFVIASIVVGDINAGTDLTRLILVGTAILSGILAGLALMPGSNRQAAESGNPLFFAGVAAMEPDEFRARIAEMTETDGQIYETVVADLHASARTLANRKYPLLRASYQVLIVGMVLTLASAILGL